MAGITIPTKDNPTPASRKAWVDAAWGAVIASIPAGMAMQIGGPVAAVATSLIGIGAGYSIGKNTGEHQQEQELSDGKREVKNPTFWNHKLAKGFVAGSLITAGAQLLMSTVLQLGSGASAAVGAVTSLATLGLAVAGGFQGKKEMGEEYAQARQIDDAARQKDILVAVAQAQGLQQEASGPSQTKFTSAEDARRAAKPPEQQQIV